MYEKERKPWEERKPWNEERHKHWDDERRFPSQFKKAPSSANKFKDEIEDKTNDTKAEIKNNEKGGEDSGQLETGEINNSEDKNLTKRYSESK